MISRRISNNESLCEDIFEIHSIHLYLAVIFIKRQRHTSIVMQLNKYVKSHNFRRFPKTVRTFIICLLFRNFSMAAVNILCIVIIGAEKIHLIEYHCHA